mgnify:CR=1 FL=1
MEKKYMKAKKIIVITMCTLICIMAIGYAAFATNLTITGTSNIGSTWKVEFTNIEEVSKTSGVTIKNVPTATGTTATFNVDLTSPGDNIVYKITVANNGTLNAVIDDITASETGSDAINFEITGIKKGDKLASKTTTTFDVSISYDNSVTSQPNLIDSTLTININYVQDTGQTIVTDDTIIVPTRLAAKILKDNEAQADTSIDFSKISSDTNGKGLYYTSTNTEDNKVTYYFRGEVENNYVTFAGFTWKIVRINEDSSIRLIKQDSIGKSKFNTNIDENAYVGYMYGTVGASTYEETHANTNSSTIKTFIDTWYQNNLMSYSSYLADSGFCGDRSVASAPNIWKPGDTALGYGVNETVYGSTARLESFKNWTRKKPQFKCPQVNDLYTTKTTNKGNKALDYPIGLLTSDEAVYAGVVYGVKNSSIYLRNNLNFRLGTPFFGNSNSSTDSFRSDGRTYIARVQGLMDTIPVINLKSTIEITTGDGTKTNPYTIKTN